MKNKYIFLDFEYNNTSEKFLNVICVSCFEGEKYFNYWLLDAEDKTSLLDKIYQWKAEDRIFVSYNVMAEAGALYSLGIDPTTLKWIDLYLEYRCLLNCNNELSYGKQLSKEGKEIITHPPMVNKRFATKEERAKVKSNQASTSLAAACYKLLNVKIDTEEKNKMRDIIIRGDTNEIISNKVHIQMYCQSDVANLPRLLQRILQEYNNRLGSLQGFKTHLLARGEYAARTGIMERGGHPVDIQAARKFAGSVTSILNDVAREINRYHPSVRPFRWDKKDAKFKQVYKNVAAWIDTLPFKDEWPKTDTGLYSLELESFEKFFPFKHDFPLDNLGAQLLRYKNINTSMNGFKPSKKNKKNFFDDIGSDNRSRIFFNIFGSQTARNQPSSTHLLCLKQLGCGLYVLLKLGLLSAELTINHKNFSLGDYYPEMSR